MSRMQYIPSCEKDLKWEGLDFVTLKAETSAVEKKGFHGEIWVKTLFPIFFKSQIKDIYHNYKKLFQGTLKQV